MAGPTKRYLVHVKFGGDVPLRQRIIESVPTMKNHVDRLSRGKSQLAWTSDDGGSFGFFMLCDLPAGVILSQLRSPGADRWQKPGRLRNEGSALTNADSLIVLELGDTFSGDGFGRAWTWLQHNRTAARFRPRRAGALAQRHQAWADRPSLISLLRPSRQASLAGQGRTSRELRET